MRFTSFRQLIVVVFALAAVPASASVIFFSNKADWENSVTGLATFNYEGTKTVSYPSWTPVPNSGPFEIVGSPSVAGVLGNATYWWLDWGTGAVLMAEANANNTQNIKITYAGGPTAIGLYLMTLTPEAADVQVRVNGSDTYTVKTNTNPNATWWGMTGSTPISTAEFQSVPLNSVLMIDYISSGYTAATQDPMTSIPEASTTLLCGAGLLLIGSLRRRSH